MGTRFSNQPNNLILRLSYPNQYHPNTIKMQFTIAAVAAFAASASAMALNTTAPAGPVYVTEVVTHLTTYCPAATVVTAGSHTITVTAATTLTIEDCSCTLTRTSVPAVPTTTVPWPPRPWVWPLALVPVLLAPSPPTSPVPLSAWPLSSSKRITW